LGAASLEQLDGAMEIHVGSSGERRRVTRRKTGALELVLAPALDAVVVILLPSRCLEGLHAVLSSPMYPFFGD
jgi:hypothetical protein